MVHAVCQGKCLSIMSFTGQRHSGSVRHWERRVRGRDGYLELEMARAGAAHSRLRSTIEDDRRDSR